MAMKWPHWALLIPVLVAAFYFFYPRIESFFVFFPQRAFDFAPESLALVYREAYFTAEDGETLHGWFFPSEKGGPVIVHFHGNAGNISHRLDLVRPFLGQGFSVFLFDYRGFGKSSGRPSETGLYRDGVASWTYLVEKEKIAPESIFLHGHSIGAAVAIELALKKPARGVIIESAFTSAKEMARTIPLFALLSPILPTTYNNLGKIGRISCPILIVHGDRDEIVPFSMGKKLFEAATAPKFFYQVEGAGHNDVFLVGGQGYFKTFSEFAEKAKR